MHPEVVPGEDRILLARENRFLVHVQAPGDEEESRCADYRNYKYKQKFLMGFLLFF